MTTSSSRARGWAAFALPDLAAPPPAPEPAAPPEPAMPDPVALAYEQGLEDGARQVRAEYRERVDAQARLLGAAAAQLMAQREAEQARLEADLPALAVAIAQQLVVHELAADPARLHALVHRAIALLPPRPTELRVLVHPDDLATVAGATELRDATDAVLDVQWVADPFLVRGSVMVEHPQRIVDGRVDQALLALYDRMQER